MALRPLLYMSLIALTACGKKAAPKSGNATPQAPATASALVASVPSVPSMDCATPVSSSASGQR
ncbi:hypothetical protein [Xanthomonas fragariae]|uniref:hypothetical protein n=1 Tax=Xanthomonas fragariae TaxID=48664 RepID=UPI0022AAE12B|nr:hypothetical protein [Xanthomonas fragariae]WAT16369.1 hypothetical protein OZ429_09055 [Xanthomonas fragariae]